MSFSSEIKEELLSSAHSITKSCCMRAETFGEYITTTRIKSALERDFLDLLELKNVDECCIRSIIIGSFLSTGYITDPNIDYHIEVSFKNKALSDYYIKLLSMLDFTPKYMKRNNQHCVYIKEADQVSTYLSILNISKYMLIFEQVRVEKEVKNNINRKNNCEIANISKIAKASVKQIEAINKLKENKKYNKLNEKLKEVAKIRVKYPESSIKELAFLLGITKSGMKHRLDRIVKIAEE